LGHVNSLKNFDLAPDGKWVAVFQLGWTVTDRAKIAPVAFSH